MKAQALSRAAALSAPSGWKETVTRLSPALRGSRVSSEEAITLPDSAHSEPGVESMLGSGQGREVAGEGRGVVQLARSFPRLLEARNSPLCA